jgi:fructose-specific phosphotransferase system IIC component
MTRKSIYHGLGYGVASTSWLFAGCARAPSFDIAGSLFPAWLACLAIGLLLTVLARWFLLRWQITIIFPMLVYPSLAALFTFLLWLVFFS